MAKKKSVHIFKPRTHPRYLLGSVSPIVWQDDLSFYNRHLLNRFNAVAVVDTSPPKMNPRNCIKTRRLSDDASRIISIDKANKQLLKKINVINRSKGYVDTFNPNAYSRTSRWNAHKTKMLDLQVENKMIHHRLKTTKPVYSTGEYDRLWRRTVGKMAHMAKYTLLMFKEKSIDRVVQEMPPISGELPKLKPRPLCYMDFRVKDGVYLGRIIIELYADYVPLTVDNFLGLIKGTKGYRYRGCKIYNIVKGQYLETGDVTMNNGKGGTSIYGDLFHEENYLLKHTKPGVLSMIRFGKNFNNSQFSITFDAQEHLDGKRVVFGSIIKGMKTLYQIQDLGKKVGSPIVPIYIENCNVIRKRTKRMRNGNML
ncbi:hypothetical protein Trydic_g21271 [Trypoxylus dichotomus]